MSEIYFYFVFGIKFFEFFFNVFDDEVSYIGNSEVGYKMDREFV